MSTQQPPAPPPRRRRLRPGLAAAAAAAALVASAALVPTMASNAAVPPPPAGWTTVFSDDFTGGSGSLPSGANWRFSLGHSYPGGPPNWGTGEIAAHTNNPANVSLDGAGNLRITPRRDGAGNWTSARIETNKQDFKAPAGGILRIEGRIQMPNVGGAGALGYWPAFWALGSPYRGNWWNWPGVGEFDIMENVNGVDRVWGVLHCGTSPGGTCNEKNGIANSRPCPNGSCQSTFHAYRFEWDRSVNPNQLRWYVDGQLFHQVSQSQIEAGAWAQMTGHAGYFIILNVAIGGEFPDNYSGTRTPGPGIQPGVPMVIDYVAAWTRSGGGPDPTQSPPPPTCGPNLALNRPATASSQESASLAPQYAVDGNPGTRWSSTHTDNHWIQVDLGSSRALSKVRLNWEVAYSTSYQILTSTNGSTWSEASSNFGSGGVEEIGINRTARYVRMNGQTRATPYGHSLWEFEVYGACTTPGPTTSSTPGPNPTTPGPTQPPGETTWAPNTAYGIGATVTYGGIRYRCRQAHTSIVTWEPPNTPALWEQI